MSSEPPEEPHLRSEPSVLSPASPKPIHFPTPTNIPVLEMQMDVGFNQTELHMNDPAMHNTEVRPDFWRDPNEQSQQQQPPSAGDGEDASPFSTGGEAMESVRQDAETGFGAHSMEASANAEPSDSVLLSTSASHDATERAEAGRASTSAPVDSISQPSAIPGVSNIEAATFAAAQYPDDFSQQTGHIPFDQAQTLSAPNRGASVDVQALLDSLQAAPAPSGHTDDAPGAEGITVAAIVSPSSQPQAPPPGAESSPVSASGLGVPPSGLPPRPPPQEQPLIHPNYVHSQHIRDYHPHATHSAFVPHARSGSQGNIAEPNSKSYVPPVHSPSASNPSPATPAGAPGAPANGVAASHTESPNPTAGLAPPQHDQPSTPMESRRETAIAAGETPRSEDKPWDGETQRKYDRFIEDERRYVSEGRWEQFPQGSRLFVGMRSLDGRKMTLVGDVLTDSRTGNLSSEKVTKRDIFHVFHVYGDLAQISIKQAYGFVQFLRTEDCARALEAEQGTQIRDKKNTWVALGNWKGEDIMLTAWVLDLEVSKPQKNRNQNARARSRSPDYTRNKPAANVDRYVSGGRAGNSRGGESRGGESRGGESRGGESYRGSSYRSPSPRRYRDRFEDRYKTRSRSPGYGRGGGRFRSPSPKRGIDDDLPLPRRAPTDVPDVQILVLDGLNRDFISWVEQAFLSRGVRVDVLLLSPRLNEQAVVRRQIMEGVTAVSKLTRQNQATGKIGLQIFDRSGGANNVKFEEYDNQDPPICAELVVRAKQTHAPPTQPGYGAGYNSGGYIAPPPPQQQYGYGAQQQPAPYGQIAPQPTGYPPSYAQQQQFPQAHQQAAAHGIPPNLQSLITNLDPNNLQTLLSAMNTPQSAVNPNPYGAQLPPSSQPHSAVANALQQHPGLAGYLQQQAHQQQQQQQQQPPTPASAPAVNMQDILARLGTYKG